MQNLLTVNAIHAYIGYFHPTVAFMLIVHYFHAMAEYKIRNRILFDKNK